MRPITDIHRGTITPAPIINTRTVTVAATADTTQRAIDELDLAGPAIRAMHALRLPDHATLTPSGLTLHPDGERGHIAVVIDLHVDQDFEGGSALTIITRFIASDDRTHERLLDAWPVVNTLARGLVRRAARAVKEHAEADTVAGLQATNEHARAAA